MALAAAGALGLSTPVQAQILGPLHTLVAAVTAVVPSPTPAPVPLTAAPGPSSPLPTPTPKALVLRRGGPLQVGLTGSLALGERTTASQLFGAAPSPGASTSPFIGSSSSSLSQGQQSVGLQAEISRRTAATMTDLKFPLGFSSGQATQFGNVQAIFSTPHYALGYGGQVVSLFGQLPFGSTLRGEYAIVPMRAGDLTIYRGPTQGALGEIVPLLGVRWRQIEGQDLYEGGFVTANGAQTGKSSTIIAGAATTRGDLSLVGEAGLQTRHGGDNDANGLSYQFRADDGSTSSYVTSIVRHIARDYVAYGNGEIFGDDYVDAGYRRSSSLQTFSFDTSVERIGNATGGTSTNRQAALNFAGPLRFGTYSLALQSQSNEGTSTLSQWQGTATSQVSATLGHGFLLLTSQLGRTTVAGLGPVGTVGTSVGLQEPLGIAEGGITYTNFRQSSEQYGRTLQSTVGGNLSRTFGRASLGVSETASHTISALSDAMQMSTQFNVTRIISPVISLQLTYGLQSLKDRLNPVSNGRSRNFSIQINAPFSYGSSMVTGRADPRLPSTIVGRVITDTTSGGNLGVSFAGLNSSGVSNVVVVLDDKIVERTDVTGGFQFSFVTPGQHQLRVESSSLPRGVTVDQPVATIQVQGGQTAQIVFAVGDYGGITGHVYGRDDSGAVVPLPNVLLRVDGGAYSQTDATGAYGFGKLRPGKHSIGVILTSVPAFASFDPSKAKTTVDVRNGQYTPVDFNAEPLGSIAGTIVFAPELAPDFTGPVPNAYVVAEPGEHAAIVNDDGSFIVDNLPPGDYTVSVDPETLPDGTGATPEDAPITLASQEHYQGLAFLVGHERKKVVFTFLGNGSSAGSTPTISLSEHRLPPDGTATVKIDSAKDAQPVVVTAFDTHVTLKYDERAGAWLGEIEVPSDAKAGSVTVSATTAHGERPQPATLVVDPKLPIAIMQLDPANPQPGQYARVRARFLVDVSQGDRIQWQDGQVTTLGHPLTGRVFTFSVRVSLRPLHGLLLTRAARLPISLM